MEKHTKEYAEKLAEVHADTINESWNINYSSFRDGYMKAIEETKVKELLDALQSCMNDFCNGNIDNNPSTETRQKVLSAIKKATE